MPTVTVWRQHWSLTRPDGWYSVAGTDYLDAPRPSSHGPATPAPGSWTLWRSIAEPVRIHHATSRPDDVGPASLHYLAAHGPRGYRLEDDDMGRRRTADGPTLFGDDLPPDPRASAYPRATAPPARPEAAPVDPDPGLDVEPPFAHTGAALDLAELQRAAARAVAEERGREVRRREELEDAIREALPWLDPDEGTPRPSTAANILRAALATEGGEAAA